MEKLRRRWQLVSLSVFLTRAILNGPGKKGLRKMWFLLPMLVRGLYITKLGRLADFFIPTRPVSAGSDTVSKGIKDVISLIALAQ